MLGYLLHAVARPVNSIWIASSDHSWPRLPHPHDVTTVHAPGVNSDRILLLGAGAGVGYGVMSHDLSLGGQLARCLSGITGRGTDVDLIVDPRITVSNARTFLADVELARFDAVVLTLGAQEAMELLPSPIWRRYLGALLDAIAAHSPDSLRVYLVGIPALPNLVTLPHTVTGLVTRAGNRLNEVSRELVTTHPQVTFVDFQPKPGDLSTEADGDTYRQWAALIAPAMSMALDAQAPSPHETIDEDARQLALDALGVVGSEYDERFEQIIATARDLFGASGASVNFIDRDRQWVKAALGMTKDERPRSQSLCAITIQRAGIFVLEDVWADPHFGSMAWAHGASPIRFYAGYPVEAPDGHRVGALCIVDTKPRQFSTADSTLLRELALRVQALLWDRVHNA